MSTAVLSTTPSSVPVQAPIALEKAATTAWRSDQLLVGQREVLIQHGTETYRLRLTRAGKLILYK